MRFLGNIALVAKGEVVRREPGFWERFKQVFSRDKALDRRDTQSLMTAAHLLAGVKHALDGVGITNAVRLVIDGTVLFEDKVGNKDDVGDLFAAFYENEALYGRDAGHGSLSLVVALSARSDANDELRIDVVVSGRIDALARPGADVAQVLATPAQPEAFRLQFERFIGRVRDALTAALPEVQVSQAKTTTRIAYPGATGSGPVTADPWTTVHPATRPEVDAAIWQAAMRWAWLPDYTAVDATGATVGPLAAQVVRPSDNVGETPFAASDEPAWSADTFTAEEPT